MKKKSKIGDAGNYAITVSVYVAVFCVLEKTLKVLLGRIDQGLNQEFWSLPGEEINKRESLDDGAKRVLADTLGMKSVYLEQLFTLGDPQKNKQGISVSVTYLSLVYGDVPEYDTEYYRWFSVQRLSNIVPDHKKIIRLGVSRLRSEMEQSTLACILLPREFTLTELQSLYESILGNPLDKRNFRKKILSLGIIRETGYIRVGEANRPAQLYMFSSRSIKRIT